MLILKILGWILLVLLGLVLLIILLLFTALLAPVKLRLSYNREEGFYAGLRYLWIKRQLAPQPKEEPQPPKRQKRRKPGPETHGERGVFPFAAAGEYCGRPRRPARGKYGTSQGKPGRGSRAYPAAPSPA